MSQTPAIISWSGIFFYPSKEKKKKSANRFISCVWGTKLAGGGGYWRRSTDSSDAKIVSCNLRKVWNPAGIVLFLSLQLYCAVLCCAQSHPTLVIPWTVAHQAPLSVRFPQQEYWSGVPFPLPGDVVSLTAEEEKVFLEPLRVPDWVWTLNWQRLTGDTHTNVFNVNCKRHRSFITKWRWAEESEIWVCLSQIWWRGQSRRNT